MWQNRIQSALGIAKCGRMDYKVRQGLQSVVGLKSDLVQPVLCNNIQVLYWNKTQKLSQWRIEGGQGV